MKKRWWESRGVWAVLSGLATAMLVATTAFSADAPSKAKRDRAAAKRATFPQKTAPAPKEVAVNWSKSTKSAGRATLPITNGKNLGKALTTDQLDVLLALEIGSKDSSGSVADDQFARRIYLDVVGQLPAPADVEEFLADSSPDRKARLIDKLLAMPQYGQNWGRYWRDVVRYHTTLTMDRPSPFNEEAWLADQFNRNVSWDKTASAMISARGLSNENAAGFFIANYEGKAEELAGETARIFLGVQIACAQCHDHPSEAWKRDQFHELAAFFSRTGVRRRKDAAADAGVKILFEVGQGPAKKEYRKPDLKDPSKPGEIVQPMFLSGHSISLQADDAARRAALAEMVASKRNPLFAKAFVNRVWAELFGRGFVSPVDDLSPLREVTAPKTFDALAKSFAASNYDVKELFRTILNSKVYASAFAERQASSSASLASVVPTRLSSDQIFDAVDWVVGQIDDGQPEARRRANARSSFRQAFGFDPSVDQTEIEGSIPQALVLMNHPTLNARLEAGRPGTLLNKVLATQSDDRNVVRMLYLRTLARKPTSAETDQCLQYVREVGDRAAAFEDVLWALLNSTEFLYNH